MKAPVALIAPLLSVAVIASWLVTLARRRPGDVGEAFDLGFLDESAPELHVADDDALDEATAALLG